MKAQICISLLLALSMASNVNTTDFAASSPQMIVFTHDDFVNPETFSLTQNLTVPWTYFVPTVQAGTPSAEMTAMDCSVQGANPACGNKNNYITMLACNGHEIALHSQSHINIENYFNKVTDQVIIDEIKNNHKYLTDIGVSFIKGYRAPNLCTAMVNRDQMVF